MIFLRVFVAVGVLMFALLAFSGNMDKEDSDKRRDTSDDTK